MPQTEDANTDYLAILSEEGILFTDRNGNRISLIKRSDLMPGGYSILDASEREVCFITAWSNPAVAISGIPLYASSTTLKIYDKANGVEIGRMAVTPQSISSTRMNLSLLDRRDSIVGFISETGSGPRSDYAIKGPSGHAFAFVTVSTAKDVYSISMPINSEASEMIMVKLVAGTILFNLMQDKLP